MKRYVLPAALAALVSGVAVALAAITGVNPQSCQSPQACVDMNTQYVPLMNSPALLSPANVGVTTVAILGTTCSAAQTGQMWYVTDSTTPTFNAIVAGSGAVKVAVICNGTNWTTH